MACSNRTNIKLDSLKVVKIPAVVFLQSLFFLNLYQPLLFKHFIVPYRLDFAGLDDLKMFLPFPGSVSF